MTWQPVAIVPMRGIPRTENTAVAPPRINAWIAANPEHPGGLKRETFDSREISYHVGGLVRLMSREGNCRAYPQLDRAPTRQRETANVSMVRLADPATSDNTLI
jgi:hypothetical protein